MITLASDFGSPYPAAMRGVILQRSDARLVDVAHDLPRQDVPAAAFWLRETLPWFPPAVHCAVVDPGVGTDRRAIVIRAGEHGLVGPDNGSLLPAARAIARRGRGTGAANAAADLDSSASPADLECFAVEVEEPASHTFHGRDVFAPTAARVHEAGVDALESLDSLNSTTPAVDLQLPNPEIDGDRAVADVLAIDDFGNVITNVPGSFVDGLDRLLVDGETVPVARSYAHVDPGERLVTVGSHGNVECALNQGRGDDAFGIGRGDRVHLER
jgi:S-adenosylmethionine hydrolase